MTSSFSHRPVPARCGLTLALLLCTFLPAVAAEEVVGSLGRKECLVFEGAQTFSPASILGQLDMRLEFYARSAPEAPLAGYIEWLERTVRQGYQRGGFAKASVRVTPDPAAQRLRVSVTEGPRFKCRAVKVTGLDAALTERLMNLLRVAGTLTESDHQPGQPSFYWPWVEDNHVRADAYTLGTYERSVVAAMAEMNYHGAEAQVELAFDEAQRKVDLLVRFQKPGVAGTLEQIEVEGLRVNTREDLLSFLALRPGMPMVGNVTNDVVKRLYDSGRFSGHVAQLTPLTEAGHFKLLIAVFEMTNAPALKQELTAEEKAFLKVREWVSGWEKRPADWVLEAQATRAGRKFTGEAVLGQAGLAMLVRQAVDTNQSTLRVGLVAAPQHLGYYSGSRQTKLSGKPKTSQLELFFRLEGRPTDDVGRYSLSIGGGWTSQAHGNPFAMKLGLAPVAFVGMAHPGDGVCRVRDGILSYHSDAGENPEFEMTADAATGRLMTWRMTDHTNHTELRLHCEEGGFARVLNELATASASYRNGLDSQHPWSSSLGLLVKDIREAVEQEIPESFQRMAQATGDKVNARDLLDLVATLESLPWGDLLSPMDLFSSKPNETETAEEFTLMQDNPTSLPSLSTEWIRWLGGFILKANDGIFARGSWPWVVLRDATFLAAGEARWTTNDTAQLARSQAVGPMGCLLAAEALGRFDPALAITFARQGVERATTNGFQNDLRTLLRGDDAAPKFLRGALQRAPALSESELRTLLKLFGTNSLPVVLEAFAALKADPKLPPDEALQPVVARHWDKELRPNLLRQFANRCLTTYQQTTPRPDSSVASDAAGWLRDAAESGYAPAQAMLGQLYARGLGVTADPQTAIRWLTKAAEQNHPHAACELGRIYAKLGGQENLAQANRWLRVGARDNCSAAEIGVARLLLEAKNATPEEREEGVDWLRKAAQHGSAEAEFYLGVIFEQKNQMDEAVDHFRKAAEKGVVQAMAKIGDLLSDGVSAKEDNVEAWMWLTRAGAEGNRMAAAQARRVERKLSAEQLREAKRRLREKE